MPGVVFLIVVPTANFERELVYGRNHEVPPPLQASPPQPPPPPPPLPVASNNLNINQLENSNNNSNAVLRLEVELRDKNAPKYRRAGVAVKGGAAGITNRGGKAPIASGRIAAPASPLDTRQPLVPLEKVLEELLAKLEIEHVTWTTGKKGYYHHVVFPLQSGEPCETTLHCLTELGIGTKLNSSVSVLPCSVSYDALADALNKDEYGDDFATQEEISKWNNFVESIKSKLTVKQVVDGVRAGGSLSFDYLLLIVTADSLAALGLVENNAPNIVAAMLVSPLMGPVMSITFGTIISDRELVKVGFISLALGMFLSLLFGFIFGLILGTTEMPWGQGSDWPTEEMRGRGNVRALWMGVLWALTSGTGVAVALLQGSAGPLIGVAISASLLPPVVNCGLFWALACIWLIYPDIHNRMPHLKGETYDGNTTYPFLYTDYLPTEFLINGIVSCLLTVVNVICIFITAIIVLKIKEVSAPYTASPDLKRFWETDLRTVRKTNRSTMRRPGKGGTATGAFGEKLLTGGGYYGLEEPRNRELDTVLEQALKEAEDDVTFKKVKRMSYSSNAAGELTQRLAKLAGLNRRDNQDGGNVVSGGVGNAAFGSRPGSRMNSMRHSKMHVDLKALDKLVSNLLKQRENEAPKSSAGGGGNGAAGGTSTPQRKLSSKLSRWRPTSRSAHSFNLTETAGTGGGGGGVGGGGNFATIQERGESENSSIMPTIMESGMGGGSGGNRSNALSSTNENAPPPPWTPNIAEQASNAASGAVRNVLNRLSQRLSTARDEEEQLNLTQNFMQ